MEKSIAFYRDYLGMKLRMELDIQDHRIDRVIGSKGAKCRIVHLELDGAILELFEYYAPVGGQNTAAVTNQYDKGFNHICFEVDNFHSHISELTKKGIKFLGEPIEFRPNVWVVYFYGPDGEVCEFRQSAEE